MNARTASPNARLRVVLVLLVCACAAVLSLRTWQRVDLTVGAEHTLSAGARSIVASLDGPVRVEVFLSRDLPAQFARHTQRLEDTLSEYAGAAAVPFDVVYTDPTDDDDAQKRARNLGISPRETSARSRGKLEAQLTWLGLTIHHRGLEATLPFIESMTLVEYELARMLRDLQGGATKQTLAIVTGHGEPDLLAALADERHPLRPVAAALAEDYELVAVDLTKTSEIPGAASVALVMGSQAEPSNAGSAALAAFVQRGGGLAIFPLGALPDPKSRQVGPAPADHAALLEPWGLEMGESLVVQRGLNGTIRLPVTIRTPKGPRTIQQPVSSPLVPVLQNLDRQHPVTRRLKSLVAPFTRTVEIRPVAGVTSTVLALSAESSTIGAAVSSLDPRALKEIGAGERQGAWPVLVALQGALPGLDGNAPDATRVVLGGSFELPLASPGLLLSTVDWLASDEELLGIRPRITAPAMLEVPDGNARELLPLANTLGVPGLVLLFGLVRLRWRARG